MRRMLAVTVTGQWLIRATTLCVHAGDRGERSGSLEVTPSRILGAFSSPPAKRMNQASMEEPSVNRLNETGWGQGR